MAVAWSLSVSFVSVQSLRSNSLWPHGPQHARLPCQSPTPGVYSDSCPSSQWCHPTISSSVVLFSSCLQSFSASGSFPVSQFFASDGQSFGVSASASVLPVNIQDWFPLEWTGWISLQSRKLSRVFSNTTVQKHQQEEKSRSSNRFYSLGFQNHWMVTADMKLKYLIPGRKAMTNLDNVLKSRYITLPMVHIVRAMVFPVVITDMRLGP